MDSGSVDRIVPSDLIVETARDFKVDMRVYTSPAVFDAEMQRIFESTWVYVGHVNEIEHPGDFKTATIGRNPVIVSRAEDGAIHVMLNACRHRGNAVCREPRGSAQRFTCPYHEWVYSLSGELVGVTFPNGYPPDFAAKLGGLVKLRCATYRGLIFASLNDDVPGLEDHLGDVRRYIDLWADLSPEPEFRIAQPHHYGYQGNWKFQAENGIDGWHARFVHQSAFETVAEFGGPPTSMRSTVGCLRAFDHGIGILERPGISQGLSEQQREAYRELLKRRHGAARLEQLWFVRQIFIFPNVFLFDNLIRVIQPLSPEKTVVASYPLLLRGAPDDINRVRLHELQSRLCTTGMINVDDLEMFASNQTGMRSAKMRWIVLSHGMGQEQPVQGSELLVEDTSEATQRAIHREWRRLMSAGN